MIQFTNVVKTYQQGNNALNGATMQIEDGEFVFLIGPSGSGKSTIIKLITGELKPTSGTVHVNGYSLERIRKLTGLDLRQFDHAIVFRVALMVRQYLASRETR